MHLEYSIFSLQKRLLAFICIVTFIFCSLVVRLFYLQGLSRGSLMEKASGQWTRSLPIVASRGKIVDRNGATLAVSYTTYNVYVRPRNVVDKEDVARHLSAILGLDYNKVYEKILFASSSEVLVKMQVQEEQIREIITANKKGIYIGITTDRYYPYANALSQVLGYTTIDNVGQSGLELYYNKYLTGINGSSSVQSDVKGIELGNTTDEYIDAIDGLDLTLTIDINLQQIVEKALNDLTQLHKPKSSYAVVMSPKTGQILAMAMNPSLDNNNLPRDNVSELFALSKNLMIVDVYEPGSTFKILTTAAALDQKVTSTKDMFYDPGYKIVDGQKIKCWRTIGHGSENLVEGFCNSCNTVFMELALRLGKDRLYQYLRNFGLGAPTGVDFLGESGGILMDIDSVQNVDLARIGFGQAVAVTPLQLVTGISCALNGGTRYVPYFVQNISSSDGVVNKSVTPTVVKNNVVSQAVSDTLNMMMEEVVSVRGGKNSFVEGYAIGGKTGTAQKYENGVVASGKYISSFVGTYPASNPEYVLLLCVNEPSVGGYYGSVVASPFGKQIFKGLFEYMNIMPSDVASVSKTIVPNLVGLTITQAYIELNRLGLHFEVDGEEGVVVEQFPSPDTEVLDGSTILITMGGKS